MPVIDGYYNVCFMRQVWNFVELHKKQALHFDLIVFVRIIGTSENNSM